MNNRHPRMYDSATRHGRSTRRPTIDELKAAMAGRWPDAFHDAAGVSPESLDGRGHSCPRCGGNDRFSAFKDVAERGSVQCRICFNSATDPKPGDGIATLRWLLACDTATACQWLTGWLGWSRSVHRPDPPPLRRFVRLELATANDGELGAMANVMMIRSHKTPPVRRCPIFPELRPHLLRAREMAPEGAVYVQTRYDHEANILTTLEKIVTKAGLVPLAEADAKPAGYP
jgi:Zinc-binding domain of primase-helicase